MAEEANLDSSSRLYSTKFQMCLSDNYGLLEIIDCDGKLQILRVFNNRIKNFNIFMDYAELEMLRIFMTSVLKTQRAMLTNYNCVTGRVQTIYHYGQYAVVSEPTSKLSELFFYETRFDCEESKIPSDSSTEDYTNTSLSDYSDDDD